MLWKGSERKWSFMSAYFNVGVWMGWLARKEMGLHLWCFFGDDSHDPFTNLLRWARSACPCNVFFMSHAAPHEPMALVWHSGMTYIVIL